MKYNSFGTKLWSKQLGDSSGNTSVSGIEIDASNNIYLGGTTEGGLDGNVDGGGDDIVLIKYDSSGNKL